MTTHSATLYLYETPLPDTGDPASAADTASLFVAKYPRIWMVVWLPMDRETPRGFIELVKEADAWDWYITDYLEAHPEAAFLGFKDPAQNPDAYRHATCNDSVSRRLGRRTRVQDGGDYSNTYPTLDDLIAGTNAY